MEYAQIDLVFKIRLFGTATIKNFFGFYKVKYYMKLNAQIFPIYMKN